MKKLCLLFLLICGSAQAGPADSVVRIPSHGGSGTIIATGEGWTLILSCAHCFTGGARNNPLAMDVPHPAPGQPKQVGFTVVAVGHLDTADLSLVRMNMGPVPYVTQIAPADYIRFSHDCWSIGFDEMKFPVTMKPAKTVGTRGPDYLTDTRPWHGRSGGGLIEKKTGYLVGVCSAYTGPANRAETHQGHHGIYVSLATIHRFLAKAGVMKSDLPPQELVPQQQRYGPQFSPQFSPQPRQQPPGC